MRLEHKPSAVVLHTPGVEPSVAAVAAAAAAAAYEVGGRYTGVHVLPGKDVVELTVLRQQGQRLGRPGATDQLGRDAPPRGRRDR